MGFNLSWNDLRDIVNTLLMSFLLALIVWIIAVDQENPLERHQVGPIPIQVRGLAEGYQTSQDLSDKTVILEVRAPRRTWEVLSEKDFVAFIDLSGLGEGTHDVTVQVEKDNPEAEILDVQPRQLRVTIEPVVSKKVPVQVDILDSPAIGYEVQTPIVEPEEVTVTGPASLIDQVVEATAEVYLRGAKTQVERIQALSPRNAQGQPVDRVTVEPPTARLVIPITQREGRKEVAVLVQLEGQPAPGYRISKVEVEPATVVLLGDPEVLDAVPGYVETTRLSIENATGEVQEELPLLLPDNVSVLNNSTVKVTVTIAPIEGSITVTRQPTVVRLPPNTKATVSLEKVNVILSGSLPALEQLKPEDVRVELDVNDLPPGSYVIQPDVIVPEGIKVEGVLPEAIEVIIESTATPTPTATPPPSVTPTSAPTALPLTPESGLTPTPEGTESAEPQNSTIPPTP